MLDQTTAAEGTSSRARRTAVVLALLAPALVACSASGDDEPRAAAPSGTPTVSESTAPVTSEEGREPADVDEEAPAVTVPKAVRRQVTERTDDYLDETDDALRSPDPEQPQESYDHMTGPALEALLNTVAEYDQNGWRVVGRPTVVSREVIRRTKDTMVVRACLDNAKVKVVDAQGDRVPNSRPASPRTLNILTLTRLKGEWVVSDQRPATEPDC